MAQKKEPANRFRLGRIKFTIWANHTKGEEWFNVEIKRSYKDGDEWQESTKFGRDDLPIVAKGADMAYAWIWEQQKKAPETEAEEEEDSK
jgi:hypothetical protein